MAGLRNANAFKFILQVFILSQKHILGVKKVVWCGLEVSSQLVPKSTRTLVNSYPFLVNSYLTFGQLVPTPSQLVPESKNGAG